MSLNEGIKHFQERNKKTNPNLSSVSGKGQNETLEIVHPLEHTRPQLNLLTSTCLKMVARERDIRTFGWQKGKQRFNLHQLLNSGVHRPGILCRFSPESAGHFISFLRSKLKQFLFCSEHLFFSANCFENAHLLKKLLLNCFNVH
jgi:hypothetical protein